VTDKGMGELAARMPYADLGGFETDRQLTAVTDLFTVDLVTRYIAWKVSSGGEAGLNGDDGVPSEETRPVHHDLHHNVLSPAPSGSGSV
jgi:hypothetical protein